jgi:hypothetical protein
MGAVRAKSGFPFVLVSSFAEVCQRFFETVNVHFGRLNYIVEMNQSNAYVSGAVFWCICIPLVKPAAMAIWTGLGCSSKLNFEIKQKLE